MPVPPIVSAQHLKVRFLGAEAVPSTFATNLAITGSTHEVTFAFFEALLPMGPEALTASPPEVPARCVARIVVPRSRFAEIAELFGRVAASFAAEDVSQEAPRVDE